MTPKPRAIIIEDDINCRRSLCDLILADGRIEISGEGGKAEDIISLVHEFNPDFAFLDVELGNQLIFGALDQLRNNGGVPIIIFTTAFDKYALQAIKHAAFDYLLKPVAKTELETAIDMLMENFKTRTVNQNLERLLDQFRPAKKLHFSTRSGFLLIDPNDILYIHADWNYSEIYLSAEKHEIVSIAIGKLEEMLASHEHFFRINRSFIINTNYLKKVNTLTRNCHLEKAGESIQLKASVSNLMVLRRL